MELECDEKDGGYEEGCPLAGGTPRPEGLGWDEAPLELVPEDMCEEKLEPDRVRWEGACWWCPFVEEKWTGMILSVYSVIAGVH